LGVFRYAILSKMIENKIYNLFKDTNKYDLYYERYSHNLVAKKRTPIFSDEGLKIYACAEISTYFFEQGEDIYYGFMVSNNLSYSFNWSKKDFSDNNIDSDGLFENKKGYVAANTRAISRYEEARGLSQQLCTLRESFEKKNKQFDFTNKAIDWLKKGLLGELYGNISIDSCEINYFPYDKVFENEILVPPKKYFANDKVGMGLPSSALEQIGPYKANSENETVNITIVALKENEGSLNYFTKQLSTKINKLFRINVQYSFSWVDKDTVKSFSEAILPINSKNADLVIFVVKQEQKFMNPKFSPYYYCKIRRKDHDLFKIEDEYDVQDVSYLILRSVFTDLQFENPHFKSGGTYSRVDLMLEQEGIDIELKMIKKADKDETSFIKQIKVDFNDYATWADLKDLIVFIYDPYNKTTNKNNFYELSGRKVISHADFNVHIIVSN